MKNALLVDLKQRGLVAQRTAEQELDDHLSQPRKVYCGFDPTADSLHIGHLVPLLMLKRFQLAGHVPVPLVGGSTGLIGDPSFKAEERRLNSVELVQQWCDRLKNQMEQYLDFDGVENPAVMTNNYDWTGDMKLLDFLRDIGKHFSINAMIQKESVKQRIDREGSGISFTEFSYSLLQSLDFAELYKRYGCTLQVGGSDQWGNITSGIDLTRRLHGGQAYGLTVPLITKADGTKFGKTESGAVWLDAKKTSPYAFYQFWLKTADADVYKFLKYFTFLPVEEINALEEADRVREGRPEAQSVLAREVTKLVHGEAALQAAQRITDAMFSGDLNDLSEADYNQLKLDGLPTSRLPEDIVEIPLTTLLVDCGLAKSGKQVKDALQNSAIWVNGEAIGSDMNMACAEIFAAGKAAFGNFFVLRLGKKNYHLFSLN